MQKCFLCKIEGPSVNCEYVAGLGACADFMNQFKRVLELEITQKKGKMTESYKNLGKKGYNGRARRGPPK